MKQTTLHVGNYENVKYSNHIILIDWKIHSLIN